MLPNLLLPFLALSALTLGIPVDHTHLPACSATSRPCKCPHGTTFKNLTSYSIIGAPAIEVQHVMDNFFESEWQGGFNPYKTTGEACAVGATRTYNYTVFIFEETQTVQSRSADGSFVFGFAQAPEPEVVPVPGAGEFHGEWSIIRAQQTVVANETAISWNNWRCDVGTPYPAAAGHESAMGNVSAILRNAGKLTGVDVEPFTIVYTVRED